jgi:hypothetical protein
MDLVLQFQSLGFLNFSSGRHRRSPLVLRTIGPACPLLECSRVAAIIERCIGKIPGPSVRGSAISGAPSLSHPSAEHRPDDALELDMHELGQHPTR